MAPASFFAHGCNSAATSAIEASPPEAITGMLTASASAMAASRLRPASTPSREMSVWIKAATPTSSNRLAMSKALSSEVSAHAANAAAELQGNVGRFDDALDRGHIDGLAGKGAVEIDHVEILEAHRLEGSRLRRRIALKHGGARHVALLKPHACAVLEVDGGKENHDDTRLTSFAGAASQARSDDRRGPPSLARAGNDRSARRITASTSRNWRSAASPAVGSSPGGTEFPPSCRGRRPR